MPRLVRPRPAFTIIEVVVATVVFAIGLLGIAAALLVFLAQARHSRQEARGVELAAAQLERLVGRPCADSSAGADTFPGVLVQWRSGPLLGMHARAVTQSVLMLKSGTPQGLPAEFHGALPCR